MTSLGSPLVAEKRMTLPFVAQQNRPLPYVATQTCPERLSHKVLTKALDRGTIPACATHFSSANLRKRSFARTQQPPCRLLVKPETPKPFSRESSQTLRNFPSRQTASSRSVPIQMSPETSAARPKT